MTNIVHNKDGIPFDIDAIATDLNGKLDRDCLNYSDTGYNFMAGASMPSSTYIDLTLGATGTLYTAPADGYIQFAKQTTAANQFIDLSSLELYNNIGASDCMIYTQSVSNQLLAIFMPVRKGEQFIAYYNAAGDTVAFRFIYAEGSKSEAN